MPLGKNVSANIKELYKDNKKKGKARGANGKKRSRKQIITIALNAADKTRGRYPKSRRTKYNFGKVEKKLGMVQT